MPCVARFSYVSASDTKEPSIFPGQFNKKAPRKHLIEVRQECNLDALINDANFLEEKMIIDTNDSCLGKALLLQGKNVDTVGRYYRMATHPEWAITKAEAQELSKNSIKTFVVFEDFGQASKLKLTKDQGKKDGTSALNQAQAIGQPQGSAIYFAVEGLPNGYKTADLPKIREYFSGVKEAIGNKYELGVYGDGIVCKTMLGENICKYTWLAAASTSFQGTKDFMKSWKWSVAQMGPLDITTDGLSVDLNVAKNDFGAFVVPFT